MHGIVTLTNYIDVKWRFKTANLTCLKVAIFWDVAACILVDTDIDMCFGEVHRLHHQGDDSRLCENLISPNLYI
jgi:hypothetical protein